MQTSSPSDINLKGVEIIVMLAVLTARLSNAEDDAATNHLPEQAPNLTASEAYAFYHRSLGFQSQNTNSLRNLPIIARRPFILSVLPIKQAGWSLWNNSSFKYAGNNNDSLSGLAPFAAFAHVEYDISYSFYF
jgi:hypothetical protein